MQKFKFLSTRGRVGWYLNDTPSAVIRPSSGQYPGRGPSPYHSLSGSKRHSSKILSTDTICVVWKKRISKWAEEPYGTLGATRTDDKETEKTGIKTTARRNVGLFDGHVKQTYRKISLAEFGVRLLKSFLRKNTQQIVCFRIFKGGLSNQPHNRLRATHEYLASRYKFLQEFPQACCFLTLTW